MKINVFLFLLRKVGILGQEPDPSRNITDSDPLEKPRYTYL